MFIPPPELFLAAHVQIILPSGLPTLSIIQIEMSCVWLRIGLHFEFNTQATPSLTGSTKQANASVFPTSPTLQHPDRPMRCC